MFRWIHKEWLDQYEQMRRAGSWSSTPPPAPTGRATRPGPPSPTTVEVYRGKPTINTQQVGPWPFLVKANSAPVFPPPTTLPADSPGTGR